MNIYHQDRSCTCSHPAGTRGGGGDGRGPCACPRPAYVRGRASPIPPGSCCQEDRHKAPASAPLHPLSLQQAGDRFAPLPILVVKIHNRAPTLSYCANLLTVFMPSDPFSMGTTLPAVSTTASMLLRPLPVTSRTTRS